MYKPRTAAALLLALILPAPALAQNARAVIDAALAATGAADLESITYSGSAAEGNFGQSRTISFGLASTSIREYTRTIDFERPASYATGIAQPPATGGLPARVPGKYTQVITPATPEWAQQMLIWVTPWGFLRGAAAAPAPTVRSRSMDDVDYRVVTWSPPQKAPSGADYRLSGYINAENLVERVETWVEHPILGDMHVELFYSGYRRIDGVMVPTRIAQRQVGMETFVVEIRQARANPPDLAALTAPAIAAPPAGALAPASTPIASERLADGVYLIAGNYASLAVEFRDHVVVLEAGEGEARGRAVIDETRRLFPGKRIRFVVNTHAHFDHAAGLAPFVAEGATILTDDTSRYFLEQALGSPRTLVGDTLARARRKPKVEGVLDRRDLKDATRTLQLYHVEKLAHSDGMLIAYLPAERILFTADFDLPAAGQPGGPSAATLLATLERLGLQAERHVTVHSPAGGTSVESTRTLTGGSR